MFLLLLIAAGVGFAFYVRLGRRIDDLKGELREVRMQLAQLEHQRPARVEPVVPPATPFVPPREIVVPPAPPAPPAAPSVAPDVESPFAEQVSARRASIFGETPPAPATTRPLGAGALEARIGSRWLLYVGVIALMIGAAYFERLAIERGWIGEGARVIQGGLAGLLLVYGGLRFIRAGLRFYGQMVAGAGVALQYLSVYAAFNFYHLIGRPLAFACLVAITTLAAWLADRQRSQALALMAVGGGFVTPFLLPTNTDTQLSLFGYDAVLIAGTMFLAHRRSWPWLNVASYCLTILTVHTWASAFYAPSKYLPTELFLTLFCVMFLYILRHSRQATREATLARAVLWTAPVFYYIVSLRILSVHPAPMLFFLLALSLVPAFVGWQFAGARIAWVRLSFWAAVTLPLTMWADLYASYDWIWPGLAAIAGIYAIQLLTHFDATRRPGYGLVVADAVLIHAAGFGALAAGYLLVEAVWPSWVAAVALAIAIVQTAVAWVLKSDRYHALHFAVPGLAIAVQALALQLEFAHAWIGAGAAVEGAGLVWLGLRARADWLRAAGLASLVFAAGHLFALQFDRAAGQALLSEALAFGLLLIGAAYWVAWQHQPYTDGERYSSDIGVALLAAQFFTLSMITSEVEAYWAVRGGDVAASLVRPALHGLSFAVLGGVTVWLGLLRRLTFLRFAGGFAVAIAVVLTLGLAVSPVPPGFILIANSRMTASVVVVAVLAGLASLYRTLGEGIAVQEQMHSALVVLANIVTLFALTSEISAYWRVQDAFTQSVQSGDAIWLARQMSISITWAAYAVGLIVVGFRRQLPAIRYLAFALFTLTIGKVFIFDLARLDQIYRVLSIIGLAIALLVTSFLYHRSRRGMQQSEL